MTENREIVKSRKPKLLYKKRNKSDKFFARLTRRKRKLILLESEMKEGTLLPTL